MTSPEGRPAMPSTPVAPRLSEMPDERGRFGTFGGAYVSEGLVPALEQLAEGYLSAQRDRRFWDELREFNRSFIGRPTPLHAADRLTELSRRQARGGEGARIWLKREDMAHAGSHHANSAMGLALLAARMGKKRVVAETGSGLHGVAVATAATRLGIACDIYIGTDDAKSNATNIARIRLLGANVIDVGTGSRTLRDATGEAMREWAANPEQTAYIPGGAFGPHPFPAIVRDFQSIIGNETKAQCLRLLTKLPDLLVACAGGADGVGFFYPFVDDEKVQLIGVEAGGRGSGAGDHAAPLSVGAQGILHGCMSVVLQDDQGQSSSTHSVAADLNYPGAGPEMAYWMNAKRLRCIAVTDARAHEAFATLARAEGIIPSLASAHAVAEAIEQASKLKQDQNVVVCVSGRGESDVGVQG